MRSTPRWRNSRDSRRPAPNSRLDHADAVSFYRIRLGRFCMKQVARMIGVLALAVASVGAASLRPPVGPKIPVIDDYFGYKITDNYRWMEDRHSPKFVSWIKKENAYARAVLAHIPGRGALLKRIAAHTGGG